LWAKGLLFWKLQKPKEATYNFTQAVIKSNNNLNYMFARALYSSSISDFKKSFFDLNYIMKNDSTNTRALVGLGILYQKVDSIELAEIYFKKATQENKNDTTAFFLLGDLYLSQGKLLSALDLFYKAKQIIELNIDYQEHYWPFEEPIQLSSIYYKIGECYRLLNFNELMCAYFKLSFERQKKEISTEKSILLQELNNNLGTCSK
jgi:tetratricopeptide (TPR) repeat protein